MDKVTFDIEAWHLWQEDVFTAMASGKGLKIMTAGRHVGKSAFTAQAIKRLMDDLNAQPVSDIVLAEGTVYGSRYYTAEAIGGSWLEMETWCTEVFGPGNVSHIWGEEKAPEPARRWYANNRKFWFKSEKDRDWFVIKWRS